MYVHVRRKKGYVLPENIYVGDVRVSVGYPNNFLKFYWLAENKYSKTCR